MKSRGSRRVKNKLKHNRVSATMQAMIGMGQKSKVKPVGMRPQVAGRGSGFLGKKMRNR